MQDGPEPGPGNGESPQPRLLAISVGQPQPLAYRGKSVMSGIVKTPITGPVMVRWENIEGDRQADLRVHGGVDKAVYVYPAAHYDLWKDELSQALPFGSFGENLTISGLDETTIRVGDRLSIGDAVLQATTPRMPCFKLGMKMKDQRFLRRFLRSGRTGFYCRVLREGLIEPDATVSVSSAGVAPTIRELVEG